MKFSVAQVKTKEGDIDYNKKLILENIQKAKENESELVIFPQLTIPGYPARWILSNNSLVEKNITALGEIAETVEGIGALVGYIDKNPVEEGKRFYNATALIHDREVQFVSYKTHLLGYDHFTESRWFEPAISLVQTRFNNQKILIGSIEDFLFTGLIEPPYNVPDEKYEDIKRKKFDYAIVVAAKPYTYESKINVMDVLKKTAEFFKCSVIYANAAGSNGELVFEGGSLAINQSEQVISKASLFSEDFINLDTNYGAGDLHGDDSSDLQKLEQAVITVLKQYSEEMGTETVKLYFDGSLPSYVNILIAEKTFTKDKIECFVNVPEGKKEEADRFISALGIKSTPIPADQIPEDAGDKDLFISNTCLANLLDKRASGFAPHLYAPLKQIPARILAGLLKEVLTKDRDIPSLNAISEEKEISSEEKYRKVLAGETAGETGLKLPATNYFTRGPRLYTDIVKAAPRIPLFWRL